MSELLKIDPYAYTYWRNREKPQNVKMALASRELAKYAAIFIDPKTKMCCSAYRTADSAAYYSFGSGLRTDPEKCQENYQKYPHLAEELKTVYGLLRQDDSACVLERSRDYCQNRLAEAGACWGGGWGGHANPDYDLLLHSGTKGLREKIACCRAENTRKSNE